MEEDFTKNAEEEGRMEEIENAGRRLFQDSSLQTAKAAKAPKLAVCISNISRTYYCYVICNPTPCRTHPKP